jgi:hypothetical protein
MARVLLHWTAGTHKASALDKAHYHVLIEGDGAVVMGNHAIDANAKPARNPRANHTRGLNTGSIGVSLCGMLNAVERPFKAGSFPITIAQWQVAAEVVADLCEQYKIPVTPRSVIAHGDVEAVLGIKQLQKWDPLVLPWTPAISRQQVMDQFRASVQQHLSGLATATAPAAPPASGLAAAPAIIVPPSSPLATEAVAAAAGGPFTPQKRKWKSDQAVLLVHGVGNAKPGDYVDVAKAVQDASGPDVAVYSLFYDIFNDWFAAKTQFDTQIKRLIAFVRQKEGDGELNQRLAEFVGDVIWPAFSSSARLTIQHAFALQMKQIVSDALDEGLLRHDMRVSIVCHSLGCLHTYELVHELATNPAHALQPFSDGFRFRAVVFMASPVQLIRTVAGSLGDLLPPGFSTTVGAGLVNPSEAGIGGMVRSSVERWISVTGDLDPIGGHFLRRKSDWAYMNVPGQESIVVPQRLIGADDDERNLITAILNSVREDGPPALNNPHSWLDYIKSPEVRLESWLA